MAEINTTDAIPATNASNVTRYFSLPLFIATDKPSWLVDWNGAMNEIDSILQDISTASEGAVADVSAITTQVNTLSTTVQSLQGLVDEAVSDVASMQATVDSHEQRMDAIEADLITQNNLVKTLSDAVTAMQATVATLNNRVSAMETTVAGYDAEIEAATQASTAATQAVSQLQTQVQGLASDLSTAQGNISSLNTRVTALENAPASGIPTIQDLDNSAKFTRSQLDGVTSSAIGTSSGSGTLTIPANAYYIIRLSALNKSGTDTKDFITTDTGLSFDKMTLYNYTTMSSDVPEKTLSSGLLRNGNEAKQITFSWELGGSATVSASQNVQISVVCYVPVA